MNNERKVLKKVYLGIGTSKGNLYVKEYEDGTLNLELGDDYGPRTLTISREFYNACLKEFDGRYQEYGNQNVLRWFLSR